jgi:hypothetical protein
MVQTPPVCRRLASASIASAVCLFGADKLLDISAGFPIEAFGNDGRLQA